jgi:hypothetical protein
MVSLDHQNEVFVKQCFELLTYHEKSGVVCVRIVENIVWSCLKGIVSRDGGWGKALEW